MYLNSYSEEQQLKNVVAATLKISETKHFSIILFYYRFTESFTTNTSATIDFKVMLFRIFKNTSSKLISLNSKV